MISNRVEDIFSHAAALDQSGRCKNTIHCLANTVFILNADHSMLLRFPLRKTEAPFTAPVSLRANDYDSREFEEKGGNIVFTTRAGGFVWRKSCGTADLTAEATAALWRKFKPIHTNVLALPAAVTTLLEENLSHVEFSATGGSIVIRQRNVYSGAMIELTAERAAGALDLGTAVTYSDFGPIGMRTNDLLALFSFNDIVHLGFPTGAVEYIWAEGRDMKMPFHGPVGGCLYDELGTVTETKRG